MAGHAMVYHANVSQASVSHASICHASVSHCFQSKSIQGRKILKGGNYLRKYGIFLHNIQVHTTYYVVHVSDTKLGNIFIVYTAHTNYVTHQKLSNSQNKMKYLNKSLSLQFSLPKLLFVKNDETFAHLGHGEEEKEMLFHNRIQFWEISWVIIICCTNLICTANIVNPKSFE